MLGVKKFENKLILSEFVDISALLVANTVIPSGPPEESVLNWLGDDGEEARAAQ